MGYYYRRKIFCQYFSLFDFLIKSPYNIFITYVRLGGMNMSKLPQISEAEFEVMKVIWKYAPISTNEVTEKLTREFDS